MKQLELTFDNNNTAVSVERKNAEKLMDFGEKIGGARKDMFANFTVEDVSALNEAERKTYITKARLWEKPNYDEMMASGEDGFLVYMKKILRDKFPAKPCINQKDVMDTYVAFLHFTKKTTETMTDHKDGQKKVLDYMLNNDLLKKRSEYRYQWGEKSYGVAKLASLKAFFKVIFATDNDLKSLMEKEDFSSAPEDRLPRGYRVIKVCGGYRVAKGSYFISKNIHTSEACAREEAKQIAAMKKETTRKARKKRLAPIQLSNIRMTGTTYDGTNRTGEELMTVFGIRGGEFGNWLNENDAQTSLNMAYTAFYDLANAIGVPTSSISLGNRLAIGFGSRGKGTAVAHYESLREVINLTKMKGAGSLAHEWFHALDNILYAKMKEKNGWNNNYTFGTEYSSNMNPYAKVMDAILNRDYSEEEKKEFIEDRINYKKKQIMTTINAFNIADSIKKELIENVFEIIKSTKEHVFIDCDPSKYAEYNPFIAHGTEYAGKFKELVEKIKELKCSNDSQIFIIANSINSIHYYLTNAGVMAKHKKKTKYLEDAEQLDKSYAKDSYGYWASNVELFARAGAAYVYDKLMQNGIVDDYLCGHAEQKVQIGDDEGKKTFVHTSPQGKEREKINEAFDEFFKSKMVAELLY